MKKKVLAALLSGGVLVLGMLFLAAIAAPKFGTMGGGAVGHALRANLRDLQAAQLAYDAAWDTFIAAPPCPAGTPEPSFCPVPAANPHFDPFAWRPTASTMPWGRYTVELTETGFVATAEHDGRRYTIRETGEPQRAW